MPPNQDVTHGPVWYKPEEVDSILEALSFYHFLQGQLLVTVSANQKVNIGKKPAYWWNDTN
jgi:hypothetical protein